MVFIHTQYASEWLYFRRCILCTWYGVIRIGCIHNKESIIATIAPLAFSTCAICRTTVRQYQILYCLQHTRRISRPATVGAVKITKLVLFKAFDDDGACLSMMSVLLSRLRVCEWSIKEKKRGPGWESCTSVSWSVLQKASVGGWRPLQASPLNFSE